MARSLGGLTFFLKSAQADHAIFTIDGGSAAAAQGGVVIFNFAGTAVNGVFTINGGTVATATGGVMDFHSTATAGNSTLIANPGVNGGAGAGIFFFDFSTGGIAGVEAFGNALLDINAHDTSRPNAGVGSLEGDGTVFLGARSLTVGVNKLSTLFSGVITDWDTAAATVAR